MQNFRSGFPEKADSFTKLWKIATRRSYQNKKCGIKPLEWGIPTRIVCSLILSMTGPSNPKDQETCNCSNQCDPSYDEV